MGVDLSNMNNADSVRIKLLLRELKDVLLREVNNVPALCRIGSGLVRLGQTREVRKCYRAAVNALRRAIRSGDVNRALLYEETIYPAFVKAVEDEEHYQRSFADWKDALAALGRRFQDPDALRDDGGDQIAFFLHSGGMLGHTEVLLKMLESRPRSGDHRVGARVYIFSLYNPEFVARCHAAGVEVVSVVDELGQASPWVTRLAWLRQRFKEDRVGVCVWVSMPTMAAFAYSMRIAPVQIFWALRFHPLAGSYVDGYITYGSKHERERIIGKQAWRVCPVPLALDATPADAKAVAELRQRLPEGFLMGTLARPEKIDSRPFLNCVVEILKANPQARYLWTGREEHAGIASFFRSSGVADRCHFAGWVDTRLYAAALDLFLESFPLGTGVVPYQALGAGVPLLSYFSKTTVFGVSFWHEFPDGVPANLEGYPIPCARTPEEYVRLASELVSNADFRLRVAARGRQFFEEEMNSIPGYSARFFDTIAEIAADVLERRRASAG